MGAAESSSGDVVDSWPTALIARPLLKPPHCRPLRRRRTSVEAAGAADTGSSRSATRSPLPDYAVRGRSCLRTLAARGGKSTRYPVADSCCTADVSQNLGDRVRQRNRTCKRAARAMTCHRADDVDVLLEPGESGLEGWRERQSGVTVGGDRTFVVGADLSGRRCNRRPFRVRAQVSVT